jgi:hypothetical protein
MTPRLKAEDLVDKYYHLFSVELENTIDYREAKQCALIAVDEIDDIYQKLTPKDDPYYFLLELEYWQEVKQEIEKL